MPDDKREPASYVRIFSEDSDESLLAELGGAVNKAFDGTVLELHYQIPLSLVSVESPVLEGAVKDVRSLMEVTMEFLKRRKMRLKIGDVELEFPHDTTAEALAALDKLPAVVMSIRGILANDMRKETAGTDPA